MGAVGGDGWGLWEVMGGGRGRGGGEPSDEFLLHALSGLAPPAAGSLRLEAEQQRAGEEERASVPGVWKGLLLPESRRVFPFYHRLPFQMKVPGGLS